MTVPTASRPTTEICWPDISSWFASAAGAAAARRILSIYKGVDCAPEDLLAEAWLDAGARAATTPGALGFGDLTDVGTRILRQVAGRLISGRRHDMAELVNGGDPFADVAAAEEAVRTVDPVLLVDLTAIVVRRAVTDPVSFPEMLDDALLGMFEGDAAVVEAHHATYSEAVLSMVHASLGAAEVSRPH